MTRRTDSPGNRLDGILGGAGEESTDGSSGTSGKRCTARRMAEQVCAGFMLHDDDDREGTVAAFHFVDARQFRDLDESTARTAAESYVDALWAKDAVERDHVDGAGIIDSETIAEADWSPVRDALARRAEVVGMSERYAERTTTAWRRHKTGGDYWTPFMHAQRVELAVAFGDTPLPEKPSEGQSGPGSLPVRYVLGVELHDRHTEAAWREAVEVMVPYYRAILDAHEG
ncbi:hypothetical protein [Halomarina litorea]|uniref:hypothetical protein n=1 Tax=Halomarina litorea TaxID=2961595 RepID=UPI0020C215E9|nr:hypothetical protein [Halomarina sp. BCD28]